MTTSNSRKTYFLLLFYHFQALEAIYKLKTNLLNYAYILHFLHFWNTSLQQTFFAAVHGQSLSLWKAEVLLYLSPYLYIIKYCTDYLSHWTSYVGCSIASYFYPMLYCLCHNYLKDLELHKKWTKFSHWKYAQQKLLCHEPKEMSVHNLHR